MLQKNERTSGFWAYGPTWGLRPHDRPSACGPPVRFSQIALLLYYHNMEPCKWLCFNIEPYRLCRFSVVIVLYFKLMQVLVLFYSLYFRNYGVWYYLNLYTWQFLCFSHHNGIYNNASQLPVIPSS